MGTDSFTSIANTRSVVDVLMWTRNSHHITFAVFIFLACFSSYFFHLNEMKQRLKRNSKKQRRNPFQDSLKKFDLQRGQIPANKDKDLTFVGREGNLFLTFSICAKCGSTSLYRAIFEAIYGYQYNLSGPPWVQDWMNWPQNGRPVGSLLLYAGHLENLTIMPSSWHYYHVYRDPVDRYISAFFSKVRCCDPQRVRLSSELNRSKCMGDINFGDHIVKSLYYASGSLFPEHYHYEREQKICLYFDEFVDLMKKVTNSHELDPHIRPQRPFDEEIRGKYKRRTWMGNISELALELNNLPSKFGLRPITVQKTHETKRSNWKPSSNAIQSLCDIAAPEYAGLEVPLNPLCSGLQL